MNMRLAKRKVISALVLFFMLWIGVAMFHYYSNQNLTLPITPVRLPAPFNIAVLGENEFIYSNGRYFVGYNVNTGVTKALSEDNELPLPSVADIAVSTDKKYILFRSVDQDYRDFLGKTLVDRQISPLGVTDFWWLYSTDRRTFMPIDARIIGTSSSPFAPKNLLARLSTDGRRVYVLVRQADALKRLVIIDSNTLEKVSDFKVSNSLESYYVYRDSVVTVRDGNIIVLNNDGKETKSIKGNYSGLRGTTSGENRRLVAYTTNQATNGTIYYLVDVESGKTQKTPSADEETSRVLSDSGNIYGYKNKGKLMLLSKGSIDRTFTINLRSKEIVNAANLDIVSILSPNTILTIDRDSGAYYLLGKNIQDFQEIEQTVFSVSDSCGNCTLEYFPDEKIFISNIDDAYSTEKKRMIYASLQSKNINPDRVAVKFTFFRPPPRQ